MEPSYGGTTSYAYDAKNELKTEQSTTAGGYTGSYGYDAAGNPTTFKGQTSAYNSANQNTQNVYDKAGNPTTYKGVALTFDAENRLTSFGGTTLTNGYRGDSLRAWKQNSMGRTYFLYAAGKIICELSSTGAVTATNAIGSAGLISRRTSSGSVFYAFDNHMSVCQRLSSSGSVISTQMFDAYGSRLSSDGSFDPYAGYHGESGYYTDWETGTASSALTLLSLRYYDPSAGRFLTRDPIDYKGGANPYEYVSDNPINASDPLGTAPWDFEPWGATVACMAAIISLMAGLNPDPCNGDYNSCIIIGDCLCEFGATFAKGFAEQWGPVLAGCAEGAFSGLCHMLVDYLCHLIYHAPDPINWGCAIYSAVMDTISGCVDGAIGGMLKDNKVKEAIREAVDAALEGVMSFLGMNNELACDEKKWM